MSAPRPCPDGCHAQPTVSIGRGEYFASGICKRATVRLGADGWTHVTPGSTCRLMEAPPPKPLAPDGGARWP